MTGEFAIWLSVAAGDDAAAEAARLAGDLGRLAAVLARAELGPDTNVHKAITMDVSPRADAAVTVIGVLQLVADWDSA